MHRHTYKLAHINIHIQRHPSYLSGQGFGGIMRFQGTSVIQASHSWVSGHLIELFTQLQVFKRPEQLGAGVGPKKPRGGQRPCCWKVMESSDMPIFPKWLWWCWTSRRRRRRKRALGFTVTALIFMCDTAVLAFPPALTFCLSPCSFLPEPPLGVLLITSLVFWQESCWPPAFSHGPPPPYIPVSIRVMGPELLCYINLAPSEEKPPSECLHKFSGTQTPKVIIKNWS